MRTVSLIAVAFLSILLFGASAPVAGADVIESADDPIEVHPIEHGSLALDWSGSTVFVDPVGDPARFAELGHPDLVLVTDIHGDHLDAETLAAVTTAESVVVVPAAVAEKLDSPLRERVEVLDNGESTTVGEIGVEAIPMYNLTEERADFHPKGRGNGYVLTMGGKRIYVSGDTEDIPEMRTLERIDAAFVCMNLPYTMTVEAAADAVLDFAPDVVYPYHYRGKGGFADLERFRELVSSNPEIEVRLLEWYPE